MPSNSKLNGTLTNRELRKWREEMGDLRGKPLTIREAAPLLGLTPNGYHRLETGDRRKGEVPRYIALACAALIEGLPPYTPKRSR